ncbi:hypothetical protein MOD96_02385 [Bacillus sp. S17B2]|uniref:hypothetical protein n=1 Tax=Bacillus sp. S17B2 TaxID=2918907 RepID=UPI00227F0100|nr:hypothetical protein [Bacillus sp. S17B2]
MKTDINSSLMILKSERDSAALKLLDLIESTKHTLRRLESKLESNKRLYDSDSLQGMGGEIDIYIGKLVSYERAIERLKEHLDSDVDSDI